MTFIVPERELRFRASRAAGPGGQHVNKASTRVEVLWDVEHSPSLTDQQRARLRQRLRGRIDANGILRVAASERRSQLRNREAAVERLRRLVARSLFVPPRRKPTRKPKSADEARLKDKRERARTKAFRTRGGEEE